MSTVSRAEWHVGPVGEDLLDFDPFAEDEAEDQEYYEALEHGVPVNLDLVARALGPIDLTASAEDLFAWAEELVRRERLLPSLDVSCPIRGDGGHCLACPLGDQHIAFPAQDTTSVLCRNSRRLELVEQEIDERLARK